MPRFYFNLHNDTVTDDEEGAELIDLHAALAHATRAAREIAAATVVIGHINFSYSIAIENAEHEEVGRVSFADAVKIVD